MTARRWVLLIPAPTKWLTANGIRRMHWRRQAEGIRAWRYAAYGACLRAKLPHDLQRIRIEPVAFVHGRRVVYEAPNLAPTIKAAVDGLARNHGATPGYHLVPDDSDEHVELTAIRIERLPAHPYRLGHLQLTITDLSEDT